MEVWDGRGSGAEREEEADWNDESSGSGEEIEIEITGAMKQAKELKDTALQIYPRAVIGKSWAA